ncbi:L-idonate 5-dehydrogenase [Aestuariimicrobium kwangyangense]|uniref:L-idonate 5-dehydrogenase n=1 Tax=Aestuariimicrobium kwangyangense TaxID=396389 RepID=UPI0003B62967|nr:L-idonate 5-dehydrogenase [Aestuariimicrobium kwangyangense]
MTTMAAVRIWGAGDLRVERLPIPEPDEHQVRLRISHVGICGSDLHYWYDGANGDFVVREPLVPGHELSGRVDLDPSGTLRPGTPVTVHPARFGVSQPGLGSSPHLWPGGSYLGSAATWPHTQGAMAEFVVVDRTMVRVLPDSLPLDRAALAEPLAVALHALSQAGPVARARTLVVGAGPIGLLQVAALRAGGAATVAASDVARGPLARAQEVGADSAYWVGAAGGEELPEGFEVVFECSGTASGVNSAWRAVRRGGTVVQVGMVPAGPQSLELSRLISKEVTVRTNFRFIDEIDDAIVLLDGRPEIAAVVTHCFGLGQVAQAFEVARDSEASGKVLVRLG